MCYNKKYRIRGTQKALWSILFFITVMLWSVPSDIGAQSLPQKRGLVNDFAGVLKPQEVAAMESLSRDLLQKAGVTAVIVTVQTTDGMDPAEYANRLYRTWGIGKKGVDEGVLILNAVKDRQVRIEVGYGMEGVLPDVLAGRIVRKIIIPHLKQGQYGAGLGNGLAAVIGIAAKEKGVTITGIQQVQTRPTRKKNGFSFGAILMLLFFFMFSRRGGFLPGLLLGGMLFPRHGSGFGGGFGRGQGFSGGFSGFGGGLGGGGGGGGGY